MKLKLIDKLHILNTDDRIKKINKTVMSKLVTISMDKEKKFNEAEKLLSKIILSKFLKYKIINKQKGSDKILVPRDLVDTIEYFETSPDLDDIIRKRDELY